MGDLYHSLHWRSNRAFVRARSGDRCEDCGVRNHVDGEVLEMTLGPTGYRFLCHAHASAARRSLVEPTILDWLGAQA